MRKLLITLLLLLLPLSLHALSLDSSVTLYYGIETQDDKREDGMILRNSIRAEMVSNPFTLVFDNISIGPSLGFEFTYDSEPVSGIRLIGHEGAVFALNFKYSFQDSFSLGLEGGIGVGHYNYMDMSYASLNGYLIADWHVDRVILSIKTGLSYRRETIAGVIEIGAGLDFGNREEWT